MLLVAVLRFGLMPLHVQSEYQEVSAQDTGCVATDGSGLVPSHSFNKLEDTQRGVDALRGSAGEIAQERSFLFCFFFLKCS